MPVVPPYDLAKPLAGLNLDVPICKTGGSRLPHAICDLRVHEGMTFRWLLLSPLPGMSPSPAPPSNIQQVTLSVLFGSSPFLQRAYPPTPSPGVSGWAGYLLWVPMVPVLLPSESVSRCTDPRGVRVFSPLDQGL